MPDLANVIENIDDGETVELDTSATWNLGSDATTDASDWSINGGGVRVNVSGRPNITLNGDDWTFGGFWWDITACRHVSIRTGSASAGWTLRRLGWPEMNCDTGYVSMRLGTDDGATCRVEHVHMLGGHPGQGILNSNSRHSGHIHFENCWVEGYNGGIMAVDSGGDGASCYQGTTTADHCYFANNNLANVRLGTYEGRSYVRNSSFYINDDIQTKRGVFSYYGHTTVESCSFRGPSSEALRRRANASATCPAYEIETDANAFNVSNPSVPAGTPGSPQEAAAGESSYQNGQPGSGGSGGGGGGSGGDSGKEYENSGLNIVNLADHGLSNGDRIGPYLDDHFHDGNEVRIPAGTYEYRGGGIGGDKGNCWLVGHPDGVVFERPGTGTQIRPALSSTHGEVLIGNITVRGKKGEYQSRFRVDPEGGDIRFVNFNYPDGTVSPSDSQAFYSEGTDGTVYLDDCYFGPHGNSIAYFTYGDAKLVMDGCTLMNTNGAIRPSPQGAEIRNCQFFGDGEVPQFSQDGGAAEGAWNRMMKIEHRCRMVIEDSHFYQTNDCSSPGPFIDDQEGCHGRAARLYIHNATSTNPVRGGQGMSASNIHVSGDNTSIPWPATGDDMPNTEKTIWTPMGTDDGSDDPDDGDSGDGGTPGDDEDTGSYEELLIINGPGADNGEGTYRFEVTDHVRQTETEEASGAGPNDDVTGRVVEGRVAGDGADAFEFDGGILSFEVTSGSIGELSLNYETVQQSYLNWDHHIRIFGEGPTAWYEFSVTDDAIGLGSGTGKVEAGEAVNATNVTGSVEGQPDGFMYNGEIVDFYVDDTVGFVEIDHEQVDPDTLGSSTPDPPEDDPDHDDPDNDPDDPNDGDEEQSDILLSGQLTGRLDIKTEHGWWETGVYRQSSADNAAVFPLEIYTEDGWGQIPVYKLGDGEAAHVEIYTPHGWVGVFGLVYTRMETFESGDLGSRWVKNIDNDSVVRERETFRGGNYAARLGPSTAQVICSGPDFDDALPYYPKPGDRWSVYYKWLQGAEQTAPHADHKFAAQSWPHQSGFVQGNLWPAYEAHMEFYDDELVIRKLGGDGTEEIWSSTTCTFEQGGHYRLEIDWHPDQTSRIYARVFEVSPSSTHGSEIASTYITDGEYDRGAITLEGSKDIETDSVHVENGDGITNVDYTANRETNPNIPKTPTETELVIVAPDSGEISFRFQVNGEPSKNLNNGDMSAETGNDNLEQITDSVWEISGTVGNGFGDTFDYTAYVPPEFGILGYEMESDGGHEIRINGETIDDTVLPNIQNDIGEGDGPDEVMFEIITPDGAGEIEYEFKTTGHVAKTEASDSVWAGDNDNIELQNDGSSIVTGVTGNGYGDAYLIGDEITAFEEFTGNPYSLRWAGDEISRAELLSPSDDDFGDEGTYTLAPNGDDNVGLGNSEHPWYSIARAAEEVEAGEEIVLRGGTYNYDTAVQNLTTSGTSDNPITIRAANGESPVLRWSGNVEGWQNTATEGLLIEGADNVEIHGLELADSHSMGLHVVNSANVLVTDCTAHDNAGPGFAFTHGSTVDVRDSEAHDNGVQGSTGGDGVGFMFNGESGDVNGSYARRCYAHDNTHDGFSCDGATGVAIRRCKSGRNLEDGYSLGGGSGSSGGQYVFRCVSFRNERVGYDDGGSTDPVEIHHCTSFDDRDAFTLGSNSNGGNHDVSNCIAYDHDSLGFASTDERTNTWNLDIDNPQFASTNASSRHFLQLSDGSPCIDAGTDLGYTYEGGADLGAYEHGETTATEMTITSPSSDGITYRMRVNAEPTKVTNAGSMSAEGNDTVRQIDSNTWEIEGFVGTASGTSLKGDRYEYAPSEPPLFGIIGWTDDGGEHTLEIAGNEVDTSALPPLDSGGQGSAESGIGGGPNYQKLVRESDADQVVSTRTGLESALAGASSDDIIFVDGSSNIDMGPSRFTVPDGVTLASDRYVDGSDGARLYTGESPMGILDVEGDARVTGLRIEGPRTDWYHRADDSDIEVGINVNGANCEVDNCEVSGWGGAAVHCKSASANAHVHHCHIHTNVEDESGYGVATDESNFVLAEYNHFDTNRHAVQSSGGSYTARYNHVTGETITHHFDVHPPGGVTTKIHHNTVEPVAQVNGGNSPAVAIRETPSDQAHIHHNWFHNPQQPRNTPNDWSDEAIIQVHVNSWQNVTWNDNHYGSNEPPRSDIGAPRDGGGGGAGGGDDPSAWEPDDSLNTVYLTDHGIEDGDTIDGYLDDHWNAGNEVVVPAGTYNCNDLGAFECDGGATLVSPEGATVDYGTQSVGRLALRTDDGDLRIENLSLDGEMHGSGSGGFKLWVNGGQMEFVNFNVNFDTPDGENTIGFLLDNGSSGGDVLFDNCRIERTSNNGIYFSQVNSVNLHVTDCTFVENNIDQIRCGGDNDLIENSTFIVENAPPDYAAPTGRGIRTQEDGNVTIRNNDFCYTWSGAEPAIVFAGDSSEVINSATVENNRIRHNGPSVVIDHRYTDVGDRVSGSGNHLTGSTTDVHDSYEHLVSCRGSGCDTPDC